MNPTTHRPREHDLQVACVRWFRFSYPKYRELLWAIPNGAVLKKGGHEWGKLKAEGAMAGVADLFLMLPSGEYHGLFIEMKTDKGKQQPSQKDFEQNAIAYDYAYAMPRSTIEFERVVRNYIEYGEYEKPRIDNEEKTAE